MKVTFVIFAYNQEKLIEKAIAGAFAQDYSPMEIVISDDCSTDTTYEVCRNAASCYRGPNKVILNRNERNLGIGSHIKRIANLASGDIIIMAAGDDVSMPERVSETVKVFRQHPRASAVFSNVYRVADDGTMLGETQIRRYLNRPISVTEMVKGGGGVGMGAAGAYKKGCFFWPWDYPDFYNSEDRLLPLRAALIGDVIYLPKALVKYRESMEGFARRKNPVDIFARANAKYQQEICATLKYAMDEGILLGREAGNLLRLARGNAKFWQKYYKLEMQGGFFNLLQAQLMLIIFHRNISIGKLVRKIFG